MFKKIKVFAVLVLMMFSFSLPVLAAEDAPYDGYKYDNAENAVPSPIGYTPQKMVSSSQFEEVSFQDSSDMFVDSDGQLNIIDGINGKLVVLDNDLNLVESLYFYENNQKLPLYNISGIFIKGSGENKKYFIADPNNERVIVADSKCNVIMTLTRPQSTLISDNIAFAPSKVLVDNNDIIYVLLPGLYRGACVFSPEGEFLTFFGANKVELSAKMLLDYFWKGIVNDTQKDNMARYIPVEFSNFDITDDDFIYTVTNKTAAGGSIISTDEIKKMNTKSVNVYLEENYGDLEVAWSNKTLLDTSFIDIDVMQGGNVAALDSTQGRIFLYDENGQPITIFGCLGVLEGGFRNPVAIETIGGRIYVLDKMGNAITMFLPTDYGKTLLSALEIYNDGRYKESLPLWKDVIRQSGGYDLAYICMGKIAFNEGDYKTAMNYYKLGHSPELYSDAFKQHRNIELRKMFYLIFIAVALFIAWVIISDMRNRTCKSRYVNANNLNAFKKVKYTFFHPTEAYESAISHQSIGLNIKVSVVCLILWFFATILTWQYNGYIFNQNIVQDFNIWMMFGKTFLVFILFVISNWFVATMMDGNGRVIDIIYVGAVGLLPYIIYQFSTIVLTNVLTLDEGVFITLLGAVAIIWSVILIISGIKAIHEFSFGKTVVTLLFSIIGILIILFLALLLWSLFQQLITFVAAIYEEISLKLR